MRELNTAAEVKRGMIFCHSRWHRTELQNHSPKSKVFCIYICSTASHSYLHRKDNIHQVEWLPYKKIVEMDSSG